MNTHSAVAPRLYIEPEESKVVGLEESKVVNTHTSRGTTFHFY
ncbi:unnamed protein product [Amoebophrya sp. A25]|nr:unnamed protein product [Amoebophrya sp. A25]|eukprot:GSA25T00012925001.1